MSGSRPGTAPSDIPAVAWRCAIGSAPPGAGRTRVHHEPHIDDGPWGGVPLGGLGAGSIGRTPRGDFARWHLQTGVHRFETAPACQFSVFTRTAAATEAHVLSTIRPERPASWNWDLPVGAGTYHGLFPGAWFEYEWSRLPVRLVQHQFSPVVPGEYLESSFPVGVFDWRVENPGPEPVTVGLMFTWQNLVGRDAGMDRRGGHVNRSVRAGGAAGVVLAGPEDAAGEAWQGSFAVAAAEAPGLEVTTCSRFDVDDGAGVWADFAADGRLEADADSRPARPGEAIGAAVAATLTLRPGEERVVSFVLAWDFPVVEFGSGRHWLRRHTQEFGAAGGAAWAIAARALERRAAWLAAIRQWQEPILSDERRPAWYRAALLNELYLLVDGGTFWAAEERPGGPEIGPFAVLECFDYPFYNTLDVYFYASFALVMLWPEIAVRIVRDFAATVSAEDLEVVPVWATGGTTVRKVAGALPHDVGGPAGDPFVKLNHYHLQDPNRWKDLNSKFVLLVWQAVSLLQPPGLAEQTWPSVLAALRRLAEFDLDGDGLPEHDGTADQTYDTWVMRGPSAYGGSLWLAALRAGAALGRAAGDVDAVAWLDGLLERGMRSFEDRLWTGAYYRYDAGASSSSDSVMADQLVGQWWADATGLDPVAPPERVRAALATVFERNVRGFADGRMGAVNGTRPDGSVDTSSEQSQEVWTGTAYALAAFMAGRGMLDEAWCTAAGVDRVVEERGYPYRTPEAYDADGAFRASIYLRPLAIWALEHALRGGHA